MSTAEARRLLAEICAHDPDRLPVDPEYGEHVSLPLTMVAVAALSGWLEDARSVDDLLTACDHGLSLMSAGVFSLADWQDEIRNLGLELVPHGH